jgi:[ribosomal protein S5]-alanine N-acetyltransferase
MSPGPPPSIQLNTAHLLMRPTGAADGERAFEIQSDWDVARMLAMAAFPPDRAEIERWFAEHLQEWLAGSAYRFAAVRESKLIGVVDIASVSHREGALGYWFDRAVWGLGYATEATRAIVKFAFDDLNLSHLRAGHAFDNTASARVLRKLGFQPIDNVQVWSRSRGETIIEQLYRLERLPSDQSVKPAYGPQQTSQVAKLTKQGPACVRQNLSDRLVIDPPPAIRSGTASSLATRRQARVLARCRARSMDDRP